MWLVNIQGYKLCSKVGKWLRCDDDENRPSPIFLCWIKWPTNSMDVKTMFTATSFENYQTSLYQKYVCLYICVQFLCLFQCFNWRFSYKTKSKWHVNQLHSLLIVSKIIQQDKIVTCWLLCWLHSSIYSV